METISEKILKKGKWLAYCEPGDNYRTYVRIDDFCFYNPSETIVKIYGPSIYIGNFRDYNHGMLLTGIENKEKIVYLDKFSLDHLKYQNYLIEHDSMMRLIKYASENALDYCLKIANK